MVSQNSLVSEYVDHYSNVVPETPNAATFVKYGGTTLNLSKGVPNISIPIYTITVDGVSIPISLSYDASGIRTDELATAVGLKWRLNAGGGIFRSINNVADDNGWLTEAWTSRDDQWWIDNPYTSETTQDYLKNNPFDHSPDNFSYSIGNYSGQFIFKRKDDNTILKNKNDNFKITANRPVQSINSFDGKDVDGNRYFFGYYQKSKEINSNSVITGNNDGINNNSEGYISSWMIDSIITKNSKEIKFDYLSYDMNYTFLQKSEKVETSVCPDDFSPENDPSHSKTSILNTPKNRLISKIHTDVVEVNFNYDTITNVIWDRRLVSIEIKDKIKNNTREFQFTYDLYTGDQRLRLKEIKEVSGSEEKPPYKFVYNEDYPMPDKNTFSKDFYGYYNGKPNTSSFPFTPNIYANLPMILKPYIGDRRPSLPHLVSGNLIEIQYPTGGKTQLEYELNQEEDQSSSPDDEYERGGFSLDLTNSSFTQYVTNFNGTYGKYEHLFTVPANLITFWTGTATANISCNSDSNAIDSTGETICNDPDILPGIDCSQYKIYDMDNNGAQIDVQLIGSPSGQNLSPGNYKIEVLVRQSEILNTTNLLVNIDFSWYKYMQDQNGDPVKRPHYAGGLRVKKTKDIDTDGKVYNETEYEYSGLIGQIRPYNNFSDTQTGIVASSEFIGHPKLFKSGHFYQSVLTKKKGYDSNGLPFTLNTLSTFEQDLANSSYESKPTGTFVYNENGDILSKTLYQYTTDLTNNDYNILGKLNYCYQVWGTNHKGYNEHQNMTFTEYENHLTKEVQTEYFYDGTTLTGNSTTIKTYDYNDDELITLQEVDLRKTEIANLDYYDQTNYTTNYSLDNITTTYAYPRDYTSETIFHSFVYNKNLLSPPVHITQSKNGSLLDANYLAYDSDGNIKKVFSYNRGQETNSAGYGYIPSNYALNTTFTVDDGKLIEAEKDQGTVKSYIWDTTKTYLLAEIINKSHSDITSQLSITLDLATKTDQQLITEFNSLRESNLDAMITSYTYDPLIGVTSMTDPKGYTMYYEYDEFNRLKRVKDEAGKIISENDYHYKDQQ